MRKLVLVTVALWCAGAFPLVAQEEPDWSKIEIKAEKVAGNVYMLYGVGGFSGGNIGVSVGEDGIALVDDEFEGKKGTRAPRQALPIITFSHGVTVHLNGEDIRGLHFPSGHTDGDSVVYFTQSKVVHMGDDYFNGMYPFIDLKNGGSVKGYVAAVEKVLSELADDVKIIPGHGPLASKADLQGYLQMLKGTVTSVETGIRQGKTLDQLKKVKVTSQYDGRWGGGFMKPEGYVEQLHNGLKARP